MQIQAFDSGKKLGGREAINDLSCKADRSIGLMEPLITARQARVTDQRLGNQWFLSHLESIPTSLLILNCFLDYSWIFSDYSWSLMRMDWVINGSFNLKLCNLHRETKFQHEGNDKVTVLALNRIDVSVSTRKFHQGLLRPTSRS